MEGLEGNDGSKHLTELPSTCIPLSAIDGNMTHGSYITHNDRELFDERSNANMDNTVINDNAFEISLKFVESRAAGQRTFTLPDSVGLGHYLLDEVFRRSLVD